ncbi:unnamed protein product [Protopolystoma xenopodis]|uniref:Uncharacterized protein n=1 Tax=Protopolystoma xenopodis TaxID=117903 RepID=A0A3S5BNE6_9PLAT|nr:unnamed protein product [Protopolystoma xenopodis]
MSQQISRLKADFANHVLLGVGVFRVKCSAELVDRLKEAEPCALNCAFQDRFEAFQSGAQLIVCHLPCRDESLNTSKYGSTTATSSPPESTAGMSDSDQAPLCHSTGWKARHMFRGLLPSPQRHLETIKLTETVPLQRICKRPSSSPEHTPAKVPTARE